MSIYKSLKTGLEQAIKGEVRKVDMVEVVRCKYCEHFNPIEDGIFGECSFGNGIHDVGWFCADGERGKRNDERFCKTC